MLTGIIMSRRTTGGGSVVVLDEIFGRRDGGWGQGLARWGLDSIHLPREEGALERNGRVRVGRGSKDGVWGMEGQP